MFSLLCLIVALDVANTATHVAFKGCIPLNQCPRLHNLATEKTNSSETLSLLRRLHCGFSREKQVLVWCSELATIQCTISVDKTISGTCTYLSLCDNLSSRPSTNGNLQMYTIPTCTSVNQKYVCCPVHNTLFLGPTTSPTHSSKLPISNKKECGVQDTQKVFGGKTVQFEEFPWTVQLQYQSGAKVTRNCGGALINNKYVVTAAHCVDDYAIRVAGMLVSVVLGEYDTRNETDCVDVLGFKVCADPPVVVAVENVIVHPNWFNKPASTVDHDIALIRLVSTVTFSEYIRPICLPSATKSFKDGERLTVCGWGQTETEQASPVKLKASIPVNNRGKCVATYKSTKKLTIGGGEFCAGGEDGIDSCVGDSGGPLMYSDSNDSVWYLAGVVSFGPNQPCGVKNYPGLYTFLPKYVDWIRQQVEQS